MSGGRIHNLKSIDVDIPLHKIVGIAGVSGSGQPSLKLGILYAESSRRYPESSSTYTRQRMTQAEKANNFEKIPPAQPFGQCEIRSVIIDTVQQKVLKVPSAPGDFMMIP